MLAETVGDYVGAAAVIASEATRSRGTQGAP